MATAALAYRLNAATGMHRGDRAYQQDQVEIIAHPRTPGCVLAVLADGMGGKSGGRKAADQVVMVAKQIYERHSPARDDAADLMRQLVQESHLMIKLTAIAAEEEPHSTIAAIHDRPEPAAATSCMRATRASTTSAAPTWSAARSTTHSCSG